MDKPLQDVMRIHCFGCGSLNEHGLQIKSHEVGDELVCRWRPQPFHVAHPGMVYGGIIASVIDCHSMWAAMAHHARRLGLPLDGRDPGWAFVTGNLNIDYLKPAWIDQELELRARVAEAGDRKMLVHCTVAQEGVACARAVVTAVRIAAMPLRTPAA